MGAESVSGSNYAGSVASSRSSSLLKQARVGNERTDDNGDDIWDRRSTLEHGVFGVLFTLSKEKSETRIRIRWVLLKILLDGWQLFTTVINPEKQGWAINADSTAWTIVSVLNFTWLESLGYTAYLAVLYSMVALLAVNVAMCIWVAWCFKEHKFPVVWPIQVLRVFSSVFFQAFDVASLNLLQLGISCRYTGPEPHLMFDLFQQYSCSTSPQLVHAIVSALCLVLFVVIALLLNMAEVEVNPLSRRPHALGHSGAEVTAFGIKVLLTLVDVFLGWPKVAACFYLALALALAWQYLRWSPHLVAWVNYLKSGISVSICWCCVVLMFLLFRPGVERGDEDRWSEIMTWTMLGGLAPAFLAGAAMSWWMIRHMTAISLKALANPKALPIREVFNALDEPRDIEIAARCCRNPIEPYTPDPEAVDRVHRLIKAGLEVFPGSPYMVVLHANFMIDVLGVSQSGGRRMEEARKLNPGLMCRFIMFIRQQQATQSAAGSMNSSTSMDLLGYVEYQRKQRMVVRLHREALQAMCNFWKALDAHKISFTHLSKALSKIESSVSQAQQAYHVVLERYGNNPKLVRLYGKFLQTIKNDPWHAAEFIAEAERLEELQDGQDGGPLMPDGTPLARMDDIDSAVVLITATGQVQMANRHTHVLFGYKRGTLEGKPLSTLLAPQFNKWLAGKLADLVSLSAQQKLSSSGSLDDESQQLQQQQGAFAGPAPVAPSDDVVVGLHCERLAFPVKISLSRASGVGEDSTLVAFIEPAPVTKGEAALWVAANGTITACDPRFVAMFGWKAAEIHGQSITTLMTVSGASSSDTVAAVTGLANTRHGETATNALKRLISRVQSHRSLEAGGRDLAQRAAGGLPCTVHHKYSRTPLSCEVNLIESAVAMDTAVYHLVMRLTDQPLQLLVVNRKGAVLHSSSEVSSWLKDGMGAAGARGANNRNLPHHGSGGMFGLSVQAPGRNSQFAAEAAAGGAVGQDGEVATSAAELLAGYTLFDFLPAPWKDMHVKLLKETTSSTPPGLGLWSCRKGAEVAPTMSLRTATGKELLVRAAVETADLAGEVVHVIRMAKSSLQEGLTERRVRLRVSAEGRIIDVVEGKLRQLFGLEPPQVTGRGLWELLDETPSKAREGLLGQGPRMMAALVDRAVSHPGYSWRVHVVQPSVTRKASEVGGPAAAGAAGAMSPLVRVASVTSALQRSVLNSSSAIMQVYVEGPAGDVDPLDAAEDDPTLLVDLWPLHSVMGVLELDPTGRIKAVLEEHLRPAGLLFGLPTRALVGCLLGDLVALPPGRTRPMDLLSSGAKKSSLKASSKEATAKVGPVHKLQGKHLDALPLALDVQIIGKPPPEESYVAVVRLPVAPLVPSAVPAMAPRPAGEVAAAAAGGGGTVLRIAHTATATITTEAAAPSPFKTSQSISRSFPAPIPSPLPGAGGRGESLARRDSVLKEAPSAGVAGGSSLLLRSSLRQQASLPQQPQPEVVKPGTPSAQVRANSSLVSDEAVMDLIVGAAPDGAAAAAGHPEGGDAVVPASDAAGSAPTAAMYAKPLLASVNLDGMPQPSVTASGGAAAAGAGAGAATAKTAAEAMGRSKLADLVKSVGGGPTRTSSSLRASEEDRPSGAGQQQLRPQRSSRLGGREVERTTSDPPSLPGSMVAPAGVVMKEKGGGAWSPPVRPGARSPPMKPPAEAEDASEETASSSDKISSDGGSESKVKPKASGAQRVLEWVNSKGAFYQNSVAGDVGNGGQDEESGNDGDQSGDASSTPFSRVARRGSGRRAGADADGGPPGGKLGAEGFPGRKAPGGQGEGGGWPQDDDAASDGGQSAVSAAQSAASGTEYTRGKRYKKLIKLMDSPQAQQAQRRLRIQALLTVGVLAVVHTVCFVLTVIYIQSQRDSMLSLGRSGDALIHMNRILTDLRSLDIITANKTLPNLFTPDQADYFIERISTSANEMKTRFNEILNTHGAVTDSPIIDVLYNTHREVWDENNPDGTDKYTNLTVWDFATRFYTMAKNVEQYHEDYLASHERFANTDPGQFLLKSGPYLWDDMRVILETLLFSAVANAEQIDRLQIAFLVVEGAGISFIAACYLAYLLRAVAGQRYKLYATFLVIPLGLTRALASQNTNIMNDDEDEDGEDEDDRERAAAAAELEVSGAGGGGGAAPPQKMKRRATLNLAESGRDAPERRPSGVGGGRLGSVTSVNGVSPFGGGAPGLDRQQTLSGGEAVADADGGGTIFRASWWRRKFGGGGSSFRRRRRSSIFPISQPSFTGSPGPSGPLSAAAAAAAAKKRSLKEDSKETYIMLVPFVIWSLLVIAFYTIAVIKMNGVVDVVAVHSVVNFMTGRTYRTVFFCQELANIDEPSQLMSHRKQLYEVVKFTKDAWYTLQLGDKAYKSAGPDTERFPLVKSGVAHSSSRMEELFYSSGHCHRLQENMPCVGPDHRFYQISHTGVDSIMQQFMISIIAMSTNSSMVPEGLEDEHFDFVYNVGGKDLLDGLREIAMVHYDMILQMFSGILVLHIILFLLFWVLFIGFLVFLLNPLLKKVTKERRRIAELMSQLPLELDVEKLVAKALGATTTGPGAAPSGGNGPTSPFPQGGGGGGGGGFPDGHIGGDEAAAVNGYGGSYTAGGPDATSKWKAIIRAASSVTAGRPNGSMNMQQHRKIV